MNTDSPTSLEESPDVSQQDIFRAVKQQIKFRQQPFREPHPGWYAGFPLYSNMPSTSGSQPKFQQGACYGYFMRDKRIKWFTDNQNVVSIIVHILKGSMKPYLQDIAYAICVTCLKHNVFFKVEWIPRAQNEIADYISRIINTDDCRYAVFRNDIAELSNDLDSQLGFIPDLLAYSKSDNIVKKYFFGFLQWKKWAK
ncbi:unnamed protein product [Mytilus coruscus]|uniref:RNase H type-1 domain-containing protein n=1 Tax=Mytilus coruscus TaxID=42192 RepID=A0A6J8DJE3_MYTCO|nr:unnamed protein product [Mytilus coruscus]